MTTIPDELVEAAKAAAAEAARPMRSFMDPVSDAAASCILANDALWRSALSAALPMLVRAESKVHPIGNGRTPHPPSDAELGSVHWLYRDTGLPHWMAVRWAGFAWQKFNGELTKPGGSEWAFWAYAGPINPPFPGRYDNKSPSTAIRARGER